MKAVLLVALALVVCAAGSKAPSEAATPRVGGTVVIALSQEPACLNILSSACRQAGVGYLHAVDQVLEGAFEIGPNSTYRKNLLSSYDMTKKPFTVTYRIRPEASWSDGVPVTARDFIFTYRAMRKSKTGAYSWERMVSLRALDSKTLRVMFSAPDPDWRKAFHMILPRHVLAGEDPEATWRETIDNPKTGNPIGNGPFLVSRLEHGRQLTLVRNPGYWGPHKAYITRIVFRFVAPDQLAQSLRHGDVDMIAPGNPQAGAAALEFRRQHRAGIKVIGGPSTAWAHLEIRIGEGGHPALKFRLVRQALAYGIDRAAIADANLGEVYEDKALVKPLNSVVFPMNSPFYKPNWSKYRYRPVQARRLLEQAGCRRGVDGIYSCGGERLRFRFITTAGNEPRERTLQLIQSQLRGIGVEGDLQFTTALIGTVLPEGQFDVALFSWAPGASLAGPYYTLRCQGEQNYTGYCQRLVTEDLVQSVSTLDLEHRSRLLNRADVKLAKDAPVIPLFQNAFLMAVRSNVQGVTANAGDEGGGEDGFTWNSEDWWLLR